jgi:glycogen debranching enzyme
VSLLPVHQRLDEQRLVAPGLVNHWGYNTLGFFCPEPRYARPTPHGARRVPHHGAALHAAGIEVLLDVVYNHTRRRRPRGPTLSWRGLDNASWYRLPPTARTATRTGAAAATRWTCATRACCSW